MLGDAGSKRARLDTTMTAVEAFPSKVMVSALEEVRVAAGETLVVLEADKPVVELKPVLRPRAEPRPYGLCAGEFTTPDDFNAPLPDEILDAFEGR